MYALLVISRSNGTKSLYGPVSGGVQVWSSPEQADAFGSELFGPSNPNVTYQAFKVGA